MRAGPPSPAAAGDEVPCAGAAIFVKSVGKTHARNSVGGGTLDAPLL